jgi:small GTP-binding protein
MGDSMANQPQGDKFSPGLRLRYTLPENKAAFHRIAWSPDGRMLAAGSPDHIVRSWNAEDGSPRLELHGHFKVVGSVAWSPDGTTLASASDDNTLRLWDTATGEPRGLLQGHEQNVTSVAWSPDGRILASGSDDATVRLWDPGKLEGHSREVLCVEWAPNSQTLASASFDGTVRLWDSGTGQLRVPPLPHPKGVYSVAWSPNGEVVASGSEDRTIRIWEVASKSDFATQRVILEGHTDTVTCVDFSWDGRLLASRSLDDTIRLWQCDTWEAVAQWSEAGKWPYTGLAFHPKQPVLAALSDQDKTIQIWELDLDAILSGAPPSTAIHYTNAKVVLVGDTGVGKSGLSLVLTGHAFEPTESTHGRRVWTFDKCEIDLGDGRGQVCETLLWDLAGQPGYRIIHQLHLNKVAAALVVFDARSETDLFTGVQHWARALRQAQLRQGDAEPPMKRFLVAARLDRGRIPVSRTRLKALMDNHGFEDYFETSAKEGWDITRLTEAIREAIPWKALPKVSSTELFQSIKAFLMQEKQAGELLPTGDHLYRAFVRSKKAPVETEELRAQFDTCIGLLEGQGLIQRLSFGGLVLLQPELRDAYASAMVIAARDEPEGRGNIPEEDALAGTFFIPPDERLQNKEQERLLLLATIEDLLRHEIALRQPAEGGVYLVFPSQFNREHPEAPDPQGKAVAFTFEGPVLNAYATLAVRLSHSGSFEHKQMWKNAAEYTAAAGGTCGIFLREVEEGCGELTLFFDEGASEETRFHFEEYVHTHLKRWALPQSIRRRRIFVCHECGTPVTDLQVERRRQLEPDFIECNVCGTEVSLLDDVQCLGSAGRAIPACVDQMNRYADAQRDRDTAAAIQAGIAAENCESPCLAGAGVGSMVHIITG